MPNIKSKRSAVPGRVPTIDQLELGELALNTYDGRLFLKKSVNGVESIVILKQQEAATFAQLIAGTGLLPAIYDGTSNVVLNVDPSEININQLAGASSFIQNIDINQVSGSGTLISNFTGGTSPDSFAITGSNLFKGHQILSGSLLVSSSINTTFNITLIDTTGSLQPTPTATLLAPTPTPTATAIGATPNPTPTPTPAKTPVPTMTLGPVVSEIFLSNPYCRTNNCNDNAYCGIKFNIYIANAPAGAKVTVTQTGGGGSVTVVNGNDVNTAYLLRTEMSATEPATAFTLTLRNSANTPIATHTTTIPHYSLFEYLPLCT